MIIENGTERKIETIQQARRDINGNSLPAEEQKKYIDKELLKSFLAKRIGLADEDKLNFIIEELIEKYFKILPRVFLFLNHNEELEKYIKDSAHVFYMHQNETKKIMLRFGLDSNFGQILIEVNYEEDENERKSVG